VRIFAGTAIVFTGHVLGKWEGPHADEPRASLDRIYSLRNGPFYRYPLLKLAGYPGYRINYLLNVLKRKHRGRAITFLLLP